MDECKLNFVQPLSSPDGSPYASIYIFEIEDNVSKWSNTLVGYVIGDKPYCMHLKACVTR